MLPEVPARNSLKGRPLFICGMQGLGDNILQRILVRQFLRLGRPTYLSTPWPSLYHDFAGLRFVRPRSVLRTQGKNERRESAKYIEEAVPASHDYVRVWYSHESIRRCGSV